MPNELDSGSTLPRVHRDATKTVPFSGRYRGLPGLSSPTPGRYGAGQCFRRTHAGRRTPPRTDATPPENRQKNTIPWPAAAAAPRVVCSRAGIATRSFLGGSFGEPRIHADHSSREEWQPRTTIPLPPAGRSCMRRPGRRRIPWLWIRRERLICSRAVNREVKSTKTVIIKGGA